MATASYMDVLAACPGWAVPDLAAPQASQINVSLHDTEPPSTEHRASATSK